jgi:ABC-type Fe3+/spermidine/putrescine transport system ATPase subunit
VIRIEGLEKHFPDFALAVEHLDIRDGEYFVALGPSGAGKTVLLSCLGGIVRPDAGRIFFDDRDVTDWPPERRAVGWVSQSNTLFPHLTVVGNICFGGRYCASGREQFDARVERLVELLDLGRLLERYPMDLSSGEIQRAMLARALALEPRVLLLDEPLRGLDPTTQEFLRDELAKIHRELGTTTFHITHDHIEARVLADRIAVLNAGRIEQCGTAEEVFERPATHFVARFTGAENIFRLVEQASSLYSQNATEAQFLDRGLLPLGTISDDATHVAIRPEHVDLWPDWTADMPRALRLKGTIESLSKYGGWLRVTVRSDTTHWVAFVHPRDATRRGLTPGHHVVIAIAPEHVCALKK